MSRYTTKISKINDQLFQTNKRILENRWIINEAFQNALIYYMSSAFSPIPFLFHHYFINTMLWNVHKFVNQ